MTDVVLYDYWRSSASYRVRIALNLAGLPYEAVSVDLVAGDHKTPEHLARNPQGLVPALWIDGVMLTQSVAILSYLDQTRNLGLLPADPLDRARVEAAAHAIAMDLHPVCNLSVMKHATGGQDPARTEWMQHFITPGLRAFETLLPDGDGPFCFGEAPGLADLCLMPQIYNADRWGAPYDDCPKVQRAKLACAAHPAFVAAHPDAVKPT